MTNPDNHSTVAVTRQRGQMPSSTRLRKSLSSVLSSAAIILVSVALTLVALEFLMRWIDGVSMTTFPNYIVSQLDLIRANNGVVLFDPLLGWRLKDNVERPGFTTGAYGLRMNSDAIRDPPQGAILAVGDSFMAGSGVGSGETIPAQLEKIMSVPVLNAAGGGWGVDQMLLRAEALAPVLHPRAIIFGILSEDVLRDAYDLYGGGYKPWFKIVNGQPELEGVPVPRVESHPMSLGFRRAILGHSYLIHTLMMRLGRQRWWLADQLRYHQAQSDEDAVASVCTLMDRIVKLGQKSNAPVSVVFFWGAGQVMTDPPAWYAARAADCARQRNLPVLDLYGILRKIGQEDPERFKTLWIDEGGVLGHPSAAADAMTAELVKKAFFTESTAAPEQMH
jgi:hypothetical protein